MTKKIALVDIDGCLVEEGKLNLALVEHLKDYDDVILFTQRSIYLQTGQIPRKYILSAAPPKNMKLTTPDALQHLVKR